VAFGDFKDEARFGFWTSALRQNSAYHADLVFCRVGNWFFELLYIWLFNCHFWSISFSSVFRRNDTVFVPCFYLVSKSHKAVLEQVHGPPQLVDSGVYAWVRHPMYLGTLLFCLAFLFISVSLVSIVIWVAFFIFYDRMATYEERSLIEILGEEYTSYQKRVSKWLPRLHWIQQTSQ